MKQRNNQKRREEAQQILALIERWQQTVKAADAAMDSLAEIVGRDMTETAPLPKAVYRLSDACTEFCAGMIGDDGGGRSHNSWLAWWQYECNFGATPRSAMTQGGRTILCKSVQDLAELIISDREESCG